MTTAQKCIKYCAIALAILLIVSIFTGILTGITSLLYLFGGSDSEMPTDMQEIYTGDVPRALDMEIRAAAVRIQQGEKFSVSSNHKKIVAKLDGDTLEIEDKRNGVSVGAEDAAILITIPEDAVFKAFFLEIGAGDIDIASLTANTIELDIGAADFTAEYLSAKTRIDADLGAGNFRLASGYLCMPDFDLGVGKTALTATMIGEGDFDCGVGDLALTVYGAPSSYTVYANRGIGRFTVDGESVSDGDVIGSGENTLRISGGIGNVDVSFLQD